LTFDPRRDRSRVLEQQGRVTLDSDWNGLFEILTSAFVPDTPEWTDFNDSDPGVTLVELFTFLGENLLFQIDERQRQRRRRRRLAFLVVGTAGIGGLFLWARACRKAT
jgi:hypothetical protein